MKKMYEIMVQSSYNTQYVKVYCTEKDLDVIASALVGAINTPCCCVAKEGEGVSNSDFDFIFCDCM